MSAYESISRAPRRGRSLLTPAIVAGIGLMTVAAMQAFGNAGIVAPLAVAAALLLAWQPTFTTLLAVSLVILFEDSHPLFFSGTRYAYTTVAKGVSAIDLLFVCAVAGVTFQLIRERRPLQLPPKTLGIPLLLVAAATMSGLLVGYENGVSIKDMLLVTHGFVYIVVGALLVINLDLDGEALRRIVIGVLVLAVVKALIGVAAVASGRGVELPTENAALTYLDPTANWLIMVALLWIVAVYLRWGRPPLWLLTTVAPLLGASLLLSYRRSFWIGFGVALIVIIALGLSPIGRRVLVPTAALLALTIWLVGSFAIPGDSPIAKRAVSLQPTSVTASAEDRYRIDERANVWANIRQHPITGLGIGVPWQATARSMPLDLPRDYAHFAALYWWMKLGILGVIAYVSTLLAALALSWQLWRRAAGSYLQAAGLASLGGFVALIPIEMTATFTGIDFRFSILLGIQLGLLSVLTTRLPRTPQAT